jgi:hypothetical protein
MSDAIGPVHVKERPSIEMQSRIDAEVLFHRPLNYSDKIMAVLFHLAIHLGRSVYFFGQMVAHVVRSFHSQVSALTSLLTDAKRLDELMTLMKYLGFPVAFSD